MAILIGIGGQKQSGKTTIAKELKKYYEEKGNIVQYINFADGGKEAIASLFGINIDDLYDEEKKERMYICLKTLDVRHLDDMCGIEIFDNDLSKLDTNENIYISFRQLLQFFLSDICRKKINNSIHVNRVMNAYEEMFSNLDNYVYIVGDVRLKNEAERIFANNGNVFWLIRETGNKDTHETELILNDERINYIENNSTVCETITKITEYVNSSNT